MQLIFVFEDPAEFETFQTVYQEAKKQAGGRFKKRELYTQAPSFELGIFDSIYDPLKEMKRMGMDYNSSRSFLPISSCLQFNLGYSRAYDFWCVSGCNEDYQLSPHYPKQIIIPPTVTKMVSDFLSFIHSIRFLLTSAVYHQNFSYHTPKEISRFLMGSV